MTTNHQKFTTHLAASVDAVWIAAKWLHSLGVDVLVKATHVAPDASKWEQYADSGDLEIISKRGNKKRVEVKQLSVNFTGPDDWPYKNEFIVCEANSFKRADPKPYAYLILSADGSTVAIVHSDTANFWSKVKRQDRRYEKIEQTFFLCPIEIITWKRIVS